MSRKGHLAKRLLERPLDIIQNVHESLWTTTDPLVFWEKQGIMLSFRHCLLIATVSLIHVTTVSTSHRARGENDAQSTKSNERSTTYLVYVGTYTNGESEGIYIYEMETQSGRLKRLGVAKDIVEPSFLGIHPSYRFLYSVIETDDFRGENSGGVAAFSISRKTGRLTKLNEQSSRGAHPCHLIVDQSGKNVLVANYSGGSVASLPIRGNGRLGKATSFIEHKDPTGQKRPRAHSINVDAAGRFAFAADLGLDKIQIYRLDSEKGILTANEPPFAAIKAGSGPRHFAFHPSGRYAYLINETNMTVTAFAYNADRGSLTNLQTMDTVPGVEDRQGFSTAEVQVHPSGEFLYGSNRGHDSIVVFKVNGDSGKLTHVENEPTGGKMPRNFAIDPTGRFLFAQNQESDNIVTFSIDPQTGGLEPTGDRIEVPSPSCIKFVPKSKS